MSSILRSVARGVATHNMKEAGVQKPHEKIGGKSWFSDNWREWVKRNKKTAKSKKLQELGIRRGVTR